MSQPAKIFMFIVQALEAETLQGQIASRIAAAAKVLLASAGLDLAQVIQQLAPETQQTVRPFFA
jgi:importin-5